MKRHVSATIVALSFFGSGAARAQVGTGTTADGLDRDVETIFITGQKIRPIRVAGSAHILNEEKLEEFEYDDVQRVLNKIPGVYIRDEDGYGLRPNIGIRGVSSDRSAKVVLLEDGVLLGPAPYAAPAAYYVPLTTRMVGLEVFKGPAAVRTGPFTVGGAINYLTAEVPDGHDGQVDVAAGQFGYFKGHARYGFGTDHFGFLLEGVRLASEGFKEIDGGGDAGFEKNEIMAKVRVDSDPVDDVYHRLELKAGWSDEVSNETYLGLTREDFEASPYRRYRASALANMDWERTQLQASYDLFVGDGFEARLVAYRHDFTRAWFKLNRFADGTFPRAALRGTDARSRLQLGVLRGRPEASAGLGDAGRLRIGTNDRDFVSQGVQLDGDLRIDMLDFDQRIRFGARLHYDEIARTHTERTYEMVARGEQLGNLVRTEDPRLLTLLNRDAALAFSAYAQDEITLFDVFTVTPGARVEVISTEARDYELEGDEVDAPSDLENAEDAFAATERERSDVVFVPGLGLHYQLTGSLGLLAGVHRGFSPVAPGQPDEVEPEASWNYELGARFNRGGLSTELIGFFNDYGNLLLTCTFSAGCPNSAVGNQFNAGTVWVYGLEALASWTADLPLDVALDLDASYTLTLSEFQNDITSGNPQFEDVREGDSLPYVPEHQASATVGLSAPLGDFRGSLRASYTFVDRMRDRASQGDVGDSLPGKAALTEADFTDVQHVVDVAFQLDLTPTTRFYLKIDNLFDQAFIAAYRPFGARPGRRRVGQIGFTHRFGRDL
jgi:Fe(3+) dicitrate transport protein